MDILLPDPALVLLIGPSGAGKSTFAEAHFRPPQVVSSDALRAMLADDPADQGASAEAFQLLAFVVKGRLRRRLLTVVDATNLRAEDRLRYQRLARRHGLPCVAIAFNLGDEAFLARNAQRPGRVVDESVVGNQARRMRATLAALPAEGHDAVYVLDDVESAALATVRRIRG